MAEEVTYTSMNAMPMVHYEPISVVLGVCFIDTKYRSLELYSDFHSASVPVQAMASNEKWHQAPQIMSRKAISLE